MITGIVFLSFAEYWYTKGGRHSKCPVEGCELVYCVDCVAYLGKRCVREGHDEEEQEERVDRGAVEEVPAEGSHSQDSPKEVVQAQHKATQRHHQHRRNKSHHGVLGGE